MSISINSFLSVSYFRGQPFEFAVVKKTGPLDTFLSKVRFRKFL